MDRRVFISSAVSVSVVASTSQAFARFMGGAILDHAVPGVGLTVVGSPRELRLYFDLGVIAAYSGVQVSSSTGAAIPVSRPVNDMSDQSIVIVTFRRALSPGTYNVTWQATSVLGGPSQGAFHFSVARAAAKTGSGDKGGSGLAYDGPRRKPVPRIAIVTLDRHIVE